MRSSPSSSCFTLLHGISAKPFSKPGLGVPPFLLRQASASYVIDVLIAVIDSEISFVRLRREKDRIESEKGEEKEKERDGSIRKEFASFIRVFHFSRFLPRFWIRRMDGLLSSRRSRSFVRSFVLCAKRNEREALDRIRRLDERHAIGSRRRKTRREVGRFGEREGSKKRRR